MEHVDLSFAQERLWFLDQLIPESALYNIPLAFCIKGSLNEGFLQQAFDKLIERHEILRTVIKTLDDGKAVQEIRPISKFSMSIVDLQLNEGSNKEEEIREYIQREAVTPFHLSEGPLLRGVLLKISKDETILLLTMHHIISDGWSLSVLAKEISALYNGYCQGQEIVLPELPIQYADFALWQREWLKEDVLEKQLSYWREQLKDAPDLLELPTDHARPKEPSYRGEIYSWRLSRTIADGIKKLGKEQGATLFMTLLAAFKVLLYRYSGQNDIVVGTPIANRHYPGVEGLIGFFANTIPLRTILIPQDTFTNFLKNEVKTIYQAYDYQDVSFGHLVENFSQERYVNINPLFQTMFEMQNHMSNDWHLEQLNLSVFPASNKGAVVDLRLLASEEGDEIYLEFEYAVDLFERSTIGRMAGHFEELLKGIISTPNSKICDLPLLSKDEQHQLLVAWNETTHDYPKDKQLQELFENQVEKTPDAIAVIYEGEELTYAELNERANQLGHYLREKGAGPEVIVGISLERSLELIIGLLGILKSGSAYVPLDPNYPEDRLNFMLEDSGSKILLTKASLREKFEGYKGELILIDEIKEELGRTSSENLARLGNSENLAYVIYTSGSTGTPKGVMIQHQSVVNYICWGGEEYSCKEKGYIPLHSSYAFDMVITSLFVPLSYGDALYIIPEKDAYLFPESIFSISTPLKFLKLTPSHLKLPNNAKKQKNSFINKLIVGGEALFNENLVFWKEAYPSMEIYNEYGPTETTVGSCIFKINNNNYIAANIPIGRPIWNTQVYILDENKQPVSIGVAGELYIGGAGLARGYLNRPELTAERFIENPFSKELGSRLYRTGDKVRYLADGNIEYLGRLDEQVKIRGYRIELGEIGSVLSEHPLVQQAVVNVWEEEGQKRLVGYVVPRGKELEEDGVRHSLRTYLQSKLPDYMVPSSFVVMESLPLTASGKINRRALPPPNGEQGGQESYVAPRTELEKQLAELWSEILHVNPIGIHDNFFELGGDSISAIQMLSKARQKGIYLDITELFEQQTISELAEKIIVSSSSNIRGKHESTKSYITRIVRPFGQISLSFAQERLWFLDQLIPESALYNIPLAFCIKGSLNEGFLQQAFDKLIERHEILRTVIKTLDDGKAVQEIRPISKFSMSIVDLQLNEGSNKEEEIREYIQREAVTPFHLSEGPLLRGVLLKTKKNENIFLLTMHHSICDEWSLGILAREVSALYNGYCQGQEIVLPELPIQYADFALWQREWLKEDVLEKQLSYWREQLKDAPDLLELPTDHARPKEPSYRGEIYSWRLSRTIADGIKKLGKEQGATLFMTLLAAFKVLLYRYSGQNDIVVGTPIANRHYPGVEGLIGFFVNTLVMRSQCHGQESFVQYLETIKHMTYNAQKHQDIPFEKLVSYLKIDRSLKLNPFFQTWFVLQNIPKDPWDLERVNFDSLQTSTHVAEFDLLLLASEEGDEIYLEFEYAVDLFERSTIGRMAGHFEELLKGIISTPNSKICDLPLLSKDEQHQLLVAWNETTHDYPKDKQLQELFENQVEKTPDAIAVIYEGEELTYAELNERANQLGHYLREKGAGPEVIVGISLERSLELIIGLLGILKSGSAYVPLDPNYPEDRLNFMLEDSGSKILLTKASLREKFEGYKGELILIDEIKEELGRTSSENLARLGNSENLAYVIYTSGSTGTPKGVMIQHQSLCDRIHSLPYLYNLTSFDRFLHYGSYSFDASIEELLLPITIGGRLCIAPSSIQESLQKLPELIYRYKISTLTFVPSLLESIVDSWDFDNIKKCDSIDKFISGGEALKKELADLISHNFKGKLFNTYGPTECTIDSTIYIVSLFNLKANIPIGRPIWNTQVYILDENKQPVSIGVAGELYIGGAGLARGYLNRPELTAERFIENPFSKELGSRLYRTGDKVRYLADGNIEYLGRLDEQVKIRGYRIELGEIGSVLSEHPLVQQAVVNVWEEEGQKRLVGYVVPRGKELEEDGVRHSLRTYLQSKLPDYMVPSSFVVMESLPLTASGKINRRALPPPNGEQGGQESYVAPRTELEKQLAELWSEILHVNPIGIHDNFFELGGDSIISIQLVTAARKQDLYLEVIDIFEHQTVAGLAELISSAREGSNSKAIPVIARRR